MEDLLPNSFSLKTLLNSIIPIRDQLHLPCSWAFAAATLVSYQLKICNNEVWDFEASVQHLIEYCQGDSVEVLPKTRRGVLAVLQYIQDHGVPLQTRHPYKARQYFWKDDPRGPRIRIRGIVHLRRDTTLADIKKILHRHPIIAWMEEVYCSFLLEEWKHKEEDVYDKNTGVKVGESHYLLIIGYGNQNGRDFYEVHNSWGREWGNCGYGRILCQLVSPLAYVKEAEIDG